MKQLFGLLISILIAGFTCAQVPQKFSFQGVARDAAGKTISHKIIGLRISIRPGSALAAPVYEETHSIQSSANGIFSISVGGGLVQSGQFADIKWYSDKFFLQVEMDPEGGGNYVDLGTTQLLSVPYALYANKAEKLKDLDPFVQYGTTGLGHDLSDITWDDNKTRMLWYPRKAAFRFGTWSANKVWTDDNIGTHSFAAGRNAIAAEDYSFAFGENVRAERSHSVAIGSNANAGGLNAIAIGSNSEATGYLSMALGQSSFSSGVRSFSFGAYLKTLADESTAIGYDLQSNSKNGIVLGVSNDISDALTNDDEPNRRLFQIGNGIATLEKRSNAVTILRNGNMGIGNNVLTPTHILDVGNRMRLRSNANGMTAGLWLDNSDHVPYSFIGGFDNDRAGIYFEEAGWKFLVNRNGNATLSGTLTQNSDLRLKQNLQPLTGSFDKLYQLKGYHYQWKDKTRSQSVQTGLIAQEVEDVFPELVETDKDGFKSVNYIGLIPHLLEAVKELKRENARLGSENKKLASNATKWADLQTRIEAIEASLVHSQATSSK